MNWAWEKLIEVVLSFKIEVTFIILRKRGKVGAGGGRRIIDYKLWNINKILVPLFSKDLVNGYFRVFNYTTFMKNIEYGQKIIFFYYKFKKYFIN